MKIYNPIKLLLTIKNYKNLIESLPINYKILKISY